MPQSFDVRLPKNYQPVFPNRCVYSNEPNPDYNAVIFANGQNSWFSLLLLPLLPILLFFGWRRMQVPILKKYRFKFYLHRYGRETLFFGVILFLIFIIAPLFPRGTRFRQYKLLGVLILAAIPWIVIESYFPQRFSVTVQDDYTEYEFSSHAYGMEFLELNKSAVISASA